MRILHVNRNYLGTALHQTMMVHLDKLDVSNSVFVPVCKNVPAVISPNANVCVAACLNSVDRFFFSLKQFKITRAIEKNFEVSKFDIIHAYTLFTDGNAAMKLAKKYHKPYVVAVRNTDVNVFFAKLIHLRHRGIEIMRNAKKIIFLSEAYRKIVFEKYVPQKYFEELFAKTEIIPNGISDFWFENTPENNNKTLDNPIKLIYAGVVNKNKNIPAVQKAMEILRNEGIDSVLTVIGKVEDERELAIVKRDPSTTYFPAMPKESLIEQYRKNDIFVMPSFTETFGLVYVEAMSQGLPVVYSRGQGFDGQFEEGFIGFHCNAFDANDIACSVKKVIAMYWQIQSKCIKASLKFRWDEICDKYLKIYKSIVVAQDVVE